MYTTLETTGNITTVHTVIKSINYNIGYIEEVEQGKYKAHNANTRYIAPDGGMYYNSITEAQEAVVEAFRREYGFI